MSWENLKTFLMGLVSNKSVEIVENSKLMYINAINKILDYNTDPNDISTYLLMVDRNITNIYTFDRHFENFSGITCLPPFPDEFK